MRVQHNIPAMNSYRNYNNNAKSINKNLEKLSSGYRINRAGDDAAGLAISEKMRAQITGLEVAQKNAKDGISLVQTAEGALTEVHSMLNRMYALAEQAGTGTYDEKVDRVQLNKEVERLRDEIDRIGSTTNFNGTKLFSGHTSATTQAGDTADLSGTTGGSDTLSATISDTITDVSVTLKSADESFNGKTIDVLGLAYGSDSSTAIKQFMLEPPTGYEFASTSDGAPASENPANRLFENPSGTATVTLVDSNDATKTATIELDFSTFNPPTSTDVDDAETGTITLTVPPASTGGTSGTDDATLQDASTKTAQDQDPTKVTLSKSGIDLWVGDFPDDNNKINVALENIDSKTLVVTKDTVNLTTQQGALNSLSYIKDAIDKVSDLRGTLGAVQNRLEHTINNLSVMQENIQDAESTIRDTDVAEEMMKYTKNSILVQSAQAMLAQANQQPQSVLQLLQ